MATPQRGLSQDQCQRKGQVTPPSGARATSPMALPEGTAAGAQAGGDPGHDLEEKEGIRPGRVKGAKAVGWGGQAHASQGVSGTREEHISDPHLDTASSELEGPTLPRPAQGSGCAVTVASAFCRSRSPKSKRKEKNKERKR